MEKIEDYKLKLDQIDQIFNSDVEEKQAPSYDAMQKLFGISNEVLQKYYTVAVSFLEEKRWEDARDAFLFLTFLNSGIHNIWLGLGIAEQSLNQFETAIVAYLMAEATQPTDPVPHANTYQCLMALGNKELAEESYTKALECCGEAPEHADLKQRLIKYRAQIS